MQHLKKPVIAIAALACLVAGCNQTRIEGGYTVYTQEPRPGKIQERVNVLVDDSSCPPGQIKRVTGGNRKYGIDRKYQCIVRPF